MNFRFDEKFSGGLFIDSDIPIDQSIDYIKSNQVSKVIINSENGFSGNSIEPFCNLKEIKSLELVLYFEDISCLQRMVHLEELSISHSDPLKLDFSQYQGLRTLSFEWSKYIEGLSTQKDLEVLSISKYKGNEDDLSELISLEELQLYEGNLKSLDFIKNCINLKKIELAYLPKLRDVSALTFVCNSLEILDIDSCKNVEWKGELFSLKNLRKLTLRGVELESIDWISSIPNLEYLSITDSNIISGDIKPAENVGFVRIDNRRHYNYKFDEATMKIVPK